MPPTHQATAPPVRPRSGEGRCAFQNVIRLSSHTKKGPPEGSPCDHHRDQRRSTTATSSGVVSFNNQYEQLVVIGDPAGCPQPSDGTRREFLHPTVDERPDGPRIERLATNGLSKHCGLQVGSNPTSESQQDRACDRWQCEGLGATRVGGRGRYRGRRRHPREPSPSRRRTRTPFPCDPGGRCRAACPPPD